MRDAIPRATSSRASARNVQRAWPAGGVDWANLHALSPVGSGQGTGSGAGDHVPQHEEDVAKRGLYAQLGITEYWQYEPYGERLTPGLE